MTEQAVIWLRSLARDTLEHSNCKGCKINAAIALEELGELKKALQELKLDDPRTTKREGRVPPEEHS